MKRVVVTGIGLLTSLGINPEIIWSNLLNRKSGIKKIKNFDVSDLPCKIAGYISHDQEDENFYDRSLHLENKEIKRNDRFIQYGLAAATMAVKDSGIEDLNELDKLPRNTFLEVDVMKTRYLDNDIIEILEDFIIKARERQIDIKLVSKRGIVENPESFVEFFKNRPKSDLSLS